MHRFKSLAIIGALTLAAAAAGAADSGWGTTRGGADTPPVDYLVRKYAAKGQVGEEIGRFKATIDLRILSAGWTEVPLMEDSTAVTDLKVEAGEEKSVLLRRRDGRYWLLFGKAGDYRIALEFVTRVESRRAERSTVLALIGAVTSTVEVTVPDQSVTYKTEPVVKSEKRAVGTQTLITLYGGDVESVRLIWSGKARLEALAPMIFCAQRSTARISRGLLRFETTLNYNVLQGAVDAFNVSFPASASLLQVEGESIRTWDVDEKGDRSHILRIKLASKVDKEYTLALVFEQPVGALPSEVSLPAIEALDVRREKGFIAIHAAKGLQVEQGDVSGVSQVDVSEAAPNPPPIPPTGRSVQQMVRRPPVAREKPDLAYQYLKRPFAIDTKVSAVQPKITASVETLVSASRDTLRATSTLRYEIRDAGVFRLRVRLSTGTRLVGIRDDEKSGRRNTINNWRAEGQEVIVELRSKAEGRYSMVVETEKPVAGRSELDVPTLELLDVERETGHLAVSPRLDTKVEALTTDGQIDVKDLPRDLRLVPEGVSLAYRYIKHPYVVRIRVGKVQPEITVKTMSSLTVKETQLVLDSVLDYTIRKAGIFELRIRFPRDLRLMGPIEGEQIEDWRVDTEAEEIIVKFRSRVDGAYQVKFRANQTRENLLAPLTLPRIAAKGAKREEGFIAVRTEAAVKLKANDATSRNIRNVDVAELPPYLQALGPRPALAFEYYRQPWMLDLAVTKVNPVVTAETFSFVAIGEGKVRTVAQVDFTVQNAGVDEFLLQLPPGVKSDQVKIEGPNIKVTEEIKDPENPDVPTGKWRVLLQAKAEKSYSLSTVSFVWDLPAGGGPDQAVPVNYTGLQCINENLASEKGWIVVSPEGNAGIVLLESGLEGRDIADIDVRNIPKRYTRGITRAIIHAFKYVNHPYRIGMSVQRHQAVEALVAVAEWGKITTVVSEEGMTLSAFQLAVRNNGQQFLRMTLSKGAKVVEGYVGGVKVTLARGAGENEIKIPIAGVAEGSQNFPVEVIYRMSHDELGHSGRIALDAPSLDVPVLELRWELVVPADLGLTHSYGTMRRTLTPTMDLDRRQKTLESTYARTQAQKAQVRVNRLQRVIEGQQEDIPRAARGTVESRMLRTRGRRFYFQKLFAFQEVGKNGVVKLVSPGTIRISYARDRYLTFMGWVIVLVMTGLLIALSLKTTVKVRALTFLGLSLLFTAIFTFDDTYYPAYMQKFVAASWIGLGIVLAAVASTAIRERWHRWQEARVPAPVPLVDLGPAFGADTTAAPTEPPPDEAVAEGEGHPPDAEPAGGPDSAHEGQEEPEAETGPPADEAKEKPAPDHTSRGKKKGRRSKGD